MVSTDGVVCPEVGLAHELGRFMDTALPSLLRTATLLTGDPGAADDLVQQVLVDLWPRWQSVREAVSPLAYVRRCVVNQFLTDRRRGELLRRLPSPHWWSERVEPDPAEAVTDRVQVRELLVRLPARQRAALVLRYHHGSTHEQIAEQLGCRVGTARSLLSRGLETLRSGLEPEATRDHA